MPLCMRDCVSSSSTPAKLNDGRTSLPGIDAIDTVVMVRLPTVPLNSSVSEATSIPTSDWKMDINSSVQYD